MKTRPRSPFFRSALVAVPLLFLGQQAPAADDPAEPALTEAAEETANPEAEPVEDKTRRANPRSGKVEDGSRGANPRSEPLKEEDRTRAAKRRPAAVGAQPPPADPEVMPGEDEVPDVPDTAGDPEAVRDGTSSPTPPASESAAESARKNNPAGATPRRPARPPGQSAQPGERGRTQAAEARERAAQRTEARADERSAENAREAATAERMQTEAEKKEAAPEIVRPSEAPTKPEVRPEPVKPEPADTAKPTPEPVEPKPEMTERRSRREAAETTQAEPTEAETASKEEMVKPVTPEPSVEEEVAVVPESEPERQAETQVREATREIERELNQRKSKISGREEAQAVIDQILGAESRISQAEIAREERIRPRMEAFERSSGPDRIEVAPPEQRVEAVEYFRQRLRGENIDAPPPEFFRLSETRRMRDRGPRPLQGETRRVEVIEEREMIQPRYMNEGRRYVHYDSRESVPAILMASEAMNRVRLQPAREVAPIFYERREVSSPQAMPLPPENYRDNNAVVVSYPVDEKSMISSDDILFQQGSTQFADPYSYEIVSTLADAMKDLPAEERFAIEGHASAEGSYDSNMILSQQRAERIVREMVRRGVSPYRLLPVGYGESEARHPADAAEALRQRDRRVVVFRLREEPVAAR